MSYAGLLQRLGASFIDVCLSAPLFFFHAWLISMSKTAAIILVIPMTFAYAAYTIYCHGRFGKTLGKYLMRIRVVKITGDPIDWRSAWLRGSVDVAFAVPEAFAKFIALSLLSEDEFLSLGWIRRIKILDELTPAWFWWVDAAFLVWVIGSIITVLLNKQRRALHDFIAGTVVVRDQKISETPPRQPA